MIEYSYSKIKKINNEGIIFSDGTKILFEECRRNWAEIKGVSINDTHCIAERNINASNPYFIFYSNNKIKIVFNKTLFIRKYFNKKQFTNFQIRLNRLGYTSFDIS